MRNNKRLLHKPLCSSLFGVVFLTLAGSPSQSSLRDASSPKVGALGSPRRLHLFAKASPLGRGVTVGDGEGEDAERVQQCYSTSRVSKTKKIDRHSCPDSNGQSFLIV